MAASHIIATAKANAQIGDCEMKLLASLAAAALLAVPTAVSANPFCEPGVKCGFELPLAMPFEVTKARIEATLPIGITFEDVNPSLETFVGQDGVTYITPGQMLYTTG